MTLSKSSLFLILLLCLSPEVWSQNTTLTVTEGNTSEHTTAMVTLDMDGDGILELVSCMPNYSSTGGVVIFTGTQSGSISTSSATHSISGRGVSDYFGYSCGAGDFNGDGYDDLLVGAPQTDSNGTDSGSVFIYFGNANLNLGITQEFFGESSGSLAGQSVANAGDFNGDGYDDILVGAPNDYANGIPGTTYIILGSASLWSLNQSPLNLNTTLRYDTGNVDNLGSAVDGGGDVNGDGYDDVLIGAPNSSNGSSRSGSTFLVLGSANPTSGTLSALLNIFEYRGEAIRNYSGYSVAITQDVNGDGYDDMLIGAPQSSVGTYLGGAAYLIFGNTSLVAASSTPNSPITLSSTNALRFVGAREDAVGYSVNSAGDTDNDGFGDILIGAPGKDYPAANPIRNRGAGFLVFGRPNLIGGNLPLTIPAVQRSFYGPSTNYVSGGFLAPAGDYDGDGLDDFIVSTTDLSSSFTSLANRSWLVSGSVRTPMNTRVNTQILP